ncbi:MAG: nucleotidyltransferase [Halochromatium sp.]|nr:nucleotidyltransferase [Halochromatium sp.]
MTLPINVPREAIADFCHRNAIRRLSLFGSVLREDFRPDSDIDMLVDFEPEARVGLIGLASMEIELSRLLNRRVELHTPKGLNPGFRDRVLSVSQVQYERT